MGYRILRGDCREQMRTLDAGSVQCVVTSPPYWGLRDYGTASWDGGDPDCDHKPKIQPRASRPKGALVGSTQTVDEGTVQRDCHCGARRVDQQLGLEPTPDAYVANMVEVFREVRRVLRDDGTVWLNIGDSYATNTGQNGGKQGSTGQRRDRTFTSETKSGIRVPPGLKPKDLCMIPARLALALQADGWYLRSDVIWAKGQSFNQQTTTLGVQGGLGDDFADCAITETKGRSGSTMPESAVDRPTTSHEHVFLLTKNSRYSYDAEAVREASAPTSVGQRREFRGGGSYTGGNSKDNSALKTNATPGNDGIQAGRNLRSVWAINPQPFSEAHFATFPMKLVEPCIKAGTSQKGQCSACGAPWVREVETTYAIGGGGGPSSRTSVHSKIAVAGADSRLPVRKTKSTETVKWRPSCDCNADTEPQTVLDPFAGSGTTGIVALRLGRRFVGIELNPEYCEMAERSIGGPLFSISREGD